MITISNREKRISILVPLLIAFSLSFFLMEFVDKSFDINKFHLINVKYYFNNLDKSLFGPIIIVAYFIKSFFSIKSIEFYLAGIFAITIIITIAICIYTTVNKIKKGKFRSNLTKYLNYFILFLCFESWFIIGLVVAGMQKL